MKLLLTGPPKSGKSTLLSKLIAPVEPKRGLLTPGIEDDGERIGFDLTDNDERTAQLARVGKPTEYPVSRYFVDVPSLEGFVEPLFAYKPDQLLFIDEIGQMQLYSERFIQLAEEYLQSPNDFAGTISYIYDHPVIEKIKQDKRVLLCTVTPDNRHEFLIAYTAMFEHRAMFNHLPEPVQVGALQLARTYLAHDQYESLKKLFRNTIPYVATGRVYVNRVHDDKFMVEGNTGNHLVRGRKGAMNCDCDLFNGRNSFAGKAGECSHIQSVKLHLV